jgi:hypothetical protein
MSSSHEASGSCAKEACMPLLSVEEAVEVNQMEYVEMPE